VQPEVMSCHFPAKIALILDSAIDSRKKAQNAQRNTDAKILGITRQANGFLMGFLIYLFVFAPFVPFCGNSN
jgi:hypothetical protein